MKELNIRANKTKEINIGDEFYLEDNPDRVMICTDIGTRTIIGIEKGTNHLSTPPYDVVEYVFDEYAQYTLLIVEKKQEEVEVKVNGHSCGKIGKPDVMG